MRKVSNPYNVKRCLPRMSWSPANLFNLHQRSFGFPSNDTKFAKTTKTLFQQQFLSRKLMRGYHGDWIQEGRFRGHFLPAVLPPIVDSTRQKEDLRKGHGSASKGNKSDAKVPVGSLMMAKLESRLDVAVFRACLAPSVYNARHLVVHGRVTVDGMREMNPNTSLKPGQMFAVDPAAIHMLQPVRAEAPQESSETESSAATMDPAEVPGSEEASAPSKTPSVSAKQVLPFHLPDYAAPFLFIPPYLEVNFPTASAVYVRHPTAGPGYSEVPTPYEADGEVVRLAWEWYAVNGKRRMKRTAKPGNDYRRRGNSSSHTVDLGQQKPS